MPSIPGKRAGTTESLTADGLARLNPARIAIEIPGRAQPLVVGERSGSNLFYLSPIDPFMLLIKGALLIAMVLSIPMLIYQIWLFVAPGLLRRERKVVKPIIIMSGLLFPFGALFAYYISHLTLKVLMSFGDSIAGLQPNIVASNYLGFILTMMLVFGIVFEFPLVLLLLANFGVIDSRFLVERRKWAVVIIAIVAAVATPTPDAFTMLSMMLPLVILYEISIWIIRIMERSRRRAKRAVVPSV